jgi:hypothetical protein
MSPMMENGRLHFAHIVQVQGGEFHKTMQI